MYVFTRTENEVSGSSRQLRYVSTWWTKPKSRCSSSSKFTSEPAARFGSL